MSAEISQRRARLKTLTTQIVDIYRKGIYRFEDYIDLINKRTVKIFDMLTYILKQKNPDIPNSLKPNILQCVDCIDGIKRLYLQIDSENKILLKAILIKELNKHIVLPDEDFFIDNSRFDSAVFKSKFEIPSSVILGTLFEDSLMKLEPLRVNKDPLPLALFDFEILNSKEISIKQPLREGGQTVDININKIDTLLTPTINVMSLRPNVASSHVYIRSTLFVFKNSFEENLLNGQNLKSYNNTKKFRIDSSGVFTDLSMEIMLNQILNIDKYLTKPEFSLLIYTSLIVPPIPNLTNSLFSSISSFSEGNYLSFNLGEVRLNVKDEDYYDEYNEDGTKVWRF